MQAAAELLLAAQELTRKAAVESRFKLFLSFVRAAGRVAEGDEPAPLEPLGADIFAAASAAFDGPSLLALPIDDAVVARGLFELGHVLPPGDARDLTRADVERRLVDGPAPVFLAIARQKALSAPQSLRGEFVRARLALALAAHPRDDAGEARLALTLLTRRDGTHTWFEMPSVRSLSERRMTARLIGRAARGLAASKSSLRVIAHGDAMMVVLQRLLGDREPLVWRHAAVARGLLAEVHPPSQREIEASLLPSRSPTEWRRGITSLAASFGHDPDGAMKRLDAVLASKLIDRDAGVATAFTWGIAAGAERSPAAAEEALDKVAKHSPLAVAEGLPSALHLGPGGSFGEGTRAMVLGELERAATASSGGDQGVAAMLASLIRELGPSESSVGSSIGRAVVAYRESGSADAHAAGIAVLHQIRADEDVRQLLDVDGAELDKKTAFGVLRELERGLLEDGTLLDLLSLGDDDARSEHVESFEELVARATIAVLAREAQRVARGASPTDDAALRLQEVKTLLHLADVRVVDDPMLSGGVNERSRRIGAAMLDWLGHAPPPALARAIGATFARATGSLLRTGALGVDDVLLACAWSALAPRDVATIAEASMSPDVDAALRGFLALSERGDTEEIPATRRHPSLEESEAPLPPEVGALSELALRLEAGRPPHLRGVLSRGAHALAVVARATTLGDLLSDDDEPSTFAILDRVRVDLSTRVGEARRRLGQPVKSVAASIDAHTFDDAVRAGQQGEARAALLALRDAYRSVPEPFAELFGRAVDRAASLSPGPASTRARTAALPAWIPTDRVVGGFYVEAPLGEGGTGTVFVVARVSERGDPRAERFAMKIPLLPDGAPEDPALLFRDEARALIDVPTHPNLARFVTFDLAAKPRPVLVMELVRGPSLEETLRPESMTVSRALLLLDEILSGVGAMHAVGLAHLDLKPSNVILRDGERPVLVDYGLSGRRLRVGCASAAYGAPEVWTSEPSTTLSPLFADVYALGCLAFELLTGEPLFVGSEMAVLASHLAHDGWPPRLVALAHTHAPLASLISSALRREPHQRTTEQALAAGLVELRPMLTNAKWPLPS